MYALDDTIAAIASAPGPAARGIVRISGPHTIECLRRCIASAERVFDWTDRSPRVVHGEVASDVPLPIDVYLWPSKRSYTRELSAELHTIGSQPCLEGVLRTLCAGGARLAQPGEFTLRAFLAGRLDLTQAEAVLGVVDAQDRRDLSAALEQLSGGLSRPLAQLRTDLLDLLADLEAGLDFVEEDIQFVSAAELVRRLSAAQSQIESLDECLNARSLSSSEPLVALVGWPNTGKSSLFNALAGRDRAIVSPQSGTTRDYVQAIVGFGGVVCRLIDTAGVEPSADNGTIASAAQHLARREGDRADVRLFCIDASRPLDDWELQQSLDRNETIVVLTKCDLPRIATLGQSAIETSVVDGRGLATLSAQIGERVAAGSAGGHAVASTAARCRESIEHAAESLNRALQLAEESRCEELVAAELRRALQELGRVVGAVYTEDVLDRLFARFCIGK
jgi:tRNA modification GTPase